MNSIGQFDIIIVGAGTAGCVLANRLGADKSKRILVLEAGGRDNWHWIHIPVGYLYCIGNPRTDWMYKTEPQAGLNGRAIHYARGKVLGGCSSINGMIYMRGQARDYDEWAALTGDDAWKWENALHVFKRTEDHWNAGGDAEHQRYHASGAEWRVEQQRLSWEILDRFADACVEAGIPRISDFNRGDNEGVAKFEVNQRHGVRWSAVKAFLTPAVARGNVTVLTHAHIETLTFDEQDTGNENARVTGIRFLHEGTRKTAEAKQTILAAGAIGTPQILQLSGIGPGALLQQHGIPVKQDLAGVGGNLQDHLQLRMAFKVQGIKTLNIQANSLWGKLQMGMEYVFNKSGPLTMSPSQLGVFAKSDATQKTANLEWHVQPLSLDKFGDPLHRFPAFTASVCNLRPTARGTVHIKSPDPLQQPAIAPNYLSTAEDRQVAADSLKWNRRIAAMPALTPYKPTEFLPGPQFQTDEELATAAGNIGTTIFHPVGTCKMGRDADANAVVDTAFRVRGVQGLFVADASVMPTITSGNTNSPTILIAERASERIARPV